MKKERNLLVLGIMFGFAWLCAAALLLVAVQYKSQNRGLRQLVAALQTRAGERLQAEMLMQREGQEALRAGQSLDFLSWKLLLTDELRGANEKFSSSVKAQKDLKTRKELANLLYYVMGLSYTAGSDFSSARRYFSEALANDPRDAESCYNLGVLYAFSGGSADLKRAVEYYRKYLELAPGGRRVEEVQAKLSGLTKEK